MLILEGSSSAAVFSSTGSSLPCWNPDNKNVVYRIKERRAQNIISRCAPLEVTHKQRMLMKRANDGNLDD